MVWILTVPSTCSSGCIDITGIAHTAVAATHERALVARSNQNLAFSARGKHGNLRCNNGAARWLQEED